MDVKNNIISMKLLFLCFIIDKVINIYIGSNCWRILVNFIFLM